MRRSRVCYWRASVRNIAVGCALALQAPVLLVAQSSPRSTASSASSSAPLVRGARVRITETDVSGMTVRVGTVVSKSTDTLTLQMESKESRQMVAFADITRLELLKSSTSRAKPGGIIGFVVGAGAGAGLFHILCDPVGGDSDCTKGRLFGALAGGAVGVVVGGVIGALSANEVWEPVAAAQWRLSAVPTSRSVGLTATVRF